MGTRNTANRIVPSLAYADAPKAIEFLSKAFGFRETYRYPMDDGRIGYAELVYQDSMISLASVFEGFGETPLKLPATSCTLRCYVDDVDAHYQRALEGGATITAEISEDHGLRMYRASDPEGHRWVFATELPA
jgi:PhnB protein